MPIDRIRGFPIDKILSNRSNPQRYNKPREQAMYGQQHNSNNTSYHEDSDCSIDSDLAILPPPRRSAVSRLNPQRLAHTRHTIMKWIICLSAIFLLLLFVPRHRVTREVSPTRGLAILLWNDENPNGRWKHHQCHCAVTSNRNYTDKDIDAVVFNADRPYSIEGLDKISRTPNFLSVFAAKKPLNLAKYPLTARGESIFNFTMTYRLDSDLVWSDYYFSTPLKVYQRVQKFAKRDENFMNKMSTTAASHLRFKLKLKQYLAVYVMYEVNNSTLQQSLYLQEMREHMDLNVIQTCHETNECIPYKFMLIFESSCCPDYVHPQFYMALANFVVPVLIGGTDLSKLAPPDSYISAAQFQSPYDLAKHLTHLGAHPELYEKFFWWHSKYQIHQIRQPYCDLCRQLRHARLPRPSLYFLQWWSLYMCPDPSDFFHLEASQ